MWPGLRRALTIIALCTILVILLTPVGVGAVDPTNQVSRDRSTPNDVSWISDDAAGHEDFYYYGDQRIWLKPVSDKVAIRFSPGLGSTEQTALLAEIGLVTEPELDILGWKVTRGTKHECHALD